jgi:hypothetical protein
LEVPFFASAVGYVDVTTITTGSALPAVRDFENSIDDQLQPKWNGSVVEEENNTKKNKTITFTPHHQ